MRERNLVNDAANAISRVIHQLPERGCVDGSPREQRNNKDERETREILKKLRKSLDFYFGVD